MILCVLDNCTRDVVTQHRQNFVFILSKMREIRVCVDCAMTDTFPYTERITLATLNTVTCL